MKLHHRFFQLLLILLPTQLAYHYWPNWSFVFGIRVDYLSPTIYLTDILFFLILIFWFKDSIPQIKLSKLVLPISFLLFLLISSFLVARNQEVALYKLIRFIELFLLGIYVSKNYSLLTIDYSLTIAVVYSSLIATSQFFLQRSIGGPIWLLGERTFTASTPGISLFEVGGRQFLRPYATFPHPNVLAGFTLVSLVLIFNQKLRKTKVLVVILGIVILIISFSQAVWIVTAFLVLFYLLRNKIKKIVFPISLVIFVLILFSSFVTPLYSNEVVIKVLHERTALAKIALTMITENFLTGVGLNNFIIRLPEYSQIPQVAWFLQPVHNIFLLVFAETGIFGFLVFLWFLFLAIRKLSTHREDRKIINYQLLISLMAILLTGMLDHYWLTLQQTQLLASIVLGMIWRHEASS